ncbi:MAG: DUF1559 domain-containing protein [Thermogemmata sp.]|jgi:hypothetical protein|uniref:DUF1559 domain-containing protein n=1 Tax=Thermogemmata fonticola TaxID=2755323 RepID=A0A7V8VEF2_9BACT|nr:DUF1559 domain-containing protein [Thermogemmata fonticola]MBA2226530.1 DUF1559 domain-containing protein [Thermogemmata fonticola]
MRPLVAVSVGGLLIFLVASFVLTYTQRFRLDAARMQSQHNLRQLALAALEVQTERNDASLAASQAIPPATVVLAGIPAEDRLSWYALILARLDQQTSGAAQALALLDREAPWSAEANQQASTVRLRCALNPLAPLRDETFPAGGAAPAHYVAIAGIGREAALLTLPENAPPSPQAGAWRYDAPTPLSRVQKGLSNTLLLAETAHENGPWLRGGWATTRGIDPTEDAPPFLGTKGQFGGFFPHGGHFALCDGSVRFLSIHTTPEILLRLATIADQRAAPPE